VVARPLLEPLFTADLTVHHLLDRALLVAGLMQPICGVVFVLDGVLMGAGDGPYLAWAMLGTLAGYAPVALTFGSSGLVALWLSIGFCMVLRMLFLLHRARGSAWLVTGAVRA
jgi:Na+-driven multidrug efflux pump